MTTLDPVDWALAERIAVRVASRNVPNVPDPARLAADFARLSPQAEELVGLHTGLVSANGPARVEVTDRAGWIAANLRAFRRLLGPLLEHYREEVAPNARGFVLSAGRRVAAAELGFVLGWLSGRVLGQYDLLVADAPDDNGDDSADHDAGGTGTSDPSVAARSGDGDGDGDAVYIVGPNLVELERRFGFPPEQFRLWIALHELTHRAQFTGVPWMRGYFLKQVEQALSLANPDPAALFARLREAVTDRDGTRARMREGGLPAVLATPEQRDAIGRVGGLMSLLEGHGDVTMDRAATDLIPSAERFSRVLRARRQRSNLIQRLTGIAAKLDQYAAGERFIAAVEAAGGPRAIDRCWSGPEALPSMDEIRAPQLWIERLMPETVVA